MGETTGISWTHHTHNLWWGCEQVSPACDNCYAMTLSARYGHDVWGLDKPRRLFGEKHYDEPLGWNAKAERSGERRRVFCGSMMDICEFHPDEIVDNAMNAARRDLFERVIPRTPWLDWLLLTKRPANYATVLPDAWIKGGCPPNVWLGTTTENDEWLVRRAPYLLRVEAQVHFISYEPALGRLASLRQYLKMFRNDNIADPTGEACRTIDWVIAGGESGSRFRADADLLDWFRAARDQCAEEGVAFWFKQHSGLHPKLLGDKLDGRQHHELPRLARAA